MHFTVEAQNRCRPWIPESSVAIDATAGNGFDTLFLAECVGPRGIVYAMDIQADAIHRTQQRVDQAGFTPRVVCVQTDHARLVDHLPQACVGKVSCAMFNLGYLPHSDKTIVTQAGSTTRALVAIEPMLAIDSVLSILAYVGHPSGKEESQAVEQWIESRQSNYRIERLVDPSNPTSPILWLLRKR